MTTFALVAEGSTDHAVLETVVRSYFFSRFNREIDINPLQPRRDRTDRKFFGEEGGWERVLEFCSSSDLIENTMLYNEFLIIQIDTDCAEHDNFGVSLTVNGINRSDSDIILDTINLIVSRITPEIYEKYKERLVFAICVHSIECWLLAIHADNSKKNKRIRCEHHLEYILNRKKIRYEKTYTAYNRISKPYQKLSTLAAASNLHIGLKELLNSLDGCDRLITSLSAGYDQAPAGEVDMPV